MVKRYDAELLFRAGGYWCDMVECIDGDYIAYADYKALLDRAEIAEERVESITASLCVAANNRETVEAENANLRNLCGMDLPWPLHDTVAKLVEATKAFLHKHDNDAQGWEEWHCAAQYGEEYAKQLRAAAEGGE